MYGYIKIDKYELKYKQIASYKKMYCLVCNALKDEISKTSCILTSYDATLFLIFFDSLEFEQKEYRLSCPLNPFKRKNNNAFVSEKAMSYSAFLSVFYFYAKLKDNVLDENKWKNIHSFKKFQKSKKRDFLIDYNEPLFNLLNKKLDDYFFVEESDNASFDDLSNKMGELFGEAFKGYSEITNSQIDKSILYNIGYDFGRWIYLADAFDDLEKDVKNNAFNPIIKMEDYKAINLEYLSDKVLFMSKCITQNIYYEIKKLQVFRNLELIEILIYGMNNSILEIINKKRKDFSNEL